MVNCQTSSQSHPRRQRRYGVPRSMVANCSDAAVKGDLLHLKTSMRDRLNWCDNQLLHLIIVFLDTQTWQLKPGMDQDMADIVVDGIKHAVEAISAQFVVPLEAKGVSVLDLHDEIEDIVQYI